MYLTDTELMEIAERFQAGFLDNDIRNGNLEKGWPGAYHPQYQSYDIHSPEIVVRPELDLGDTRRTAHTYFLVNRVTGTVSCQSYDISGARV